MLKTISRIAAIHGSTVRNIHVSALSRLREIFIEKKNEKTTVLDCKYVKSPRTPYLFKSKKGEKCEKCPLCKLQLNLKYTDVLILSQYLDCNRDMIEPWNTDLCKDQYKLVKELIYMAQYAGLLPEPARDTPKKPYQLLNTYYDEKTIVLNGKKFKHHKRYHYVAKKLAPVEKLRIKPNEGSYYGPKVY